MVGLTYKLAKRHSAGAAYERETENFHVPLLFYQFCMEFSDDQLYNGEKVL